MMVKSFKNATRKGSDCRFEIIFLKDPHIYFATSIIKVFTNQLG